MVISVMQTAEVYTSAVAISSVMYTSAVSSRRSCTQVPCPSRRSCWHVFTGEILRLPVFLRDILLMLKHWYDKWRVGFGITFAR
jgi:hypothetical protein